MLLGFLLLVIVGRLVDRILPWSLVCWIGMILATFQISDITRVCIKSNSPVRNLIALSLSFFSMSIDSPSGLMTLDGLALLMVLSTADYSKDSSCRPLLRFLSSLNIALLALFCVVGCSTNCLQNCLAHFLPSICCLAPDRFLIVLQSFLGDREQRSKCSSHLVRLCSFTKWFILEDIDSSLSSTGFTALIFRC